MKGDLHPIAFRLSQSLPVRTHSAPEPEPRKTIKPGVGKANNQSLARPVRFRGVTYKSAAEARRELRVGMATLQRWLDTGAAEYVSAP